MKACRFLFNFSGDPNYLFQKALNVAKEYNASVNGNLQSGSFNVVAMGSTFKGSYIVNGNQIEVRITSKPFFIPCSVIESLVRNYLT